jgi:hypothetical protein
MQLQATQSVKTVCRWLPDNKALTASGQAAVAVGRSGPLASRQTSMRLQVQSAAHAASSAAHFFALHAVQAPASPLSGSEASQLVGMPVSTPEPLSTTPEPLSSPEPLSTTPEPLSTGPASFPASDDGEVSDQHPCAAIAAIAKPKNKPTRHLIQSSARRRDSCDADLPANERRRIGSSSLARAPPSTTTVAGQQLPWIQSKR